MVIIMHSHAKDKLAGYCNQNADTNVHLLTN